MEGRGITTLIAISKIPPSLSSSASPVSRRALKLRLSPVRLPIPPRPAGREVEPVGDPAGPVHKAVEGVTNLN